MKDKNKIKINFIKKNRDFLKVIKSSRCIKTSSLMIWINKSNDNQLLIGITISKKDFRRAHDRNYIRRQIKHMIQSINFGSNKKIVIKATKNYDPKNFESSKVELTKIIERK